MAEPSLIAGSCALLVVGSVASWFTQDLPIPQQVTVLAILAAVLGGVFWLIRSLALPIGNRMVKSIDKLADELRADRLEQGRKHEDYERIRAESVKALVERIDAIPIRVAQKLKEAK